MYIFIFAWIISPLILIPIAVKKTNENNRLKCFIESLCRSGRISAEEYISLEAEKTEKESSAKSMETSAPVFADSREFSKVHGGDAVRAAENNTVSDKKVSDIPVSEKPAAPEVKDVKSVKPETYKNLYDLPVYSYQKKPLETVNNVTQNPESDAVREVRRAAPAAVPAEQKETVKPAAEKIARANVKPNREKNKAAAMSVLMMIGIIFVILAGLVFSTAVWATMGEVGRTLAVGTVAALFFGVSAFTGKKIKLERTAFAFYILGTFFSAITLLTAGFFGIMGSYFSVSGAGSCLLYAAALLIISLFTAKGRSIFNMPASAYISAFSGIFAAVLLLVQFSENIGVFALLAAILTAVTNIFMYVLDLKISDKWEKPLRIASAVLNAVALIGGISAAFGENSVFYAAAVIFVLRSIAAAVMGFMGRKTYKTGLAAVSSLGSGAFFTLLIMFKLSVSVSVFALSAGIFAVLFAFGMFTFDIKIPEGWKDPIKMSAFILNAVGIISSFYALMRNFGEWDGVCFAVAALYIVSSFAAGIMAVCGHSRYSEAPSAFASMFTGLAFSVMLVAELSASGEIAALCLTVMLIVLVNALYTVPSKFPESWRTAAGVSTAVLGLISVFSSLFALIGNFGDWDAACCTIAALYILQAVIVTAAAYRGHGEYSKGCWAVLSQLVGIFFSVLAIAQLAENGISFMLYLTIFAAAYLNFVHTFKLKKPENWETSLKVFSYLLGIFGVIFAVPQMLYHSEWTYHFYVTAAIYIAYAIAVTAMAFLKHGEYSKTHWAVVSQITGISFIITLLSRLADSEISFMLYLTVFAVSYLNFVYTFRFKKPEKWAVPLKIFSYFLGVFGVIFTISQMLGYDQWTYYFYVTAAIYIAYSIAVTVMAFLKHDEYSKTHWAVISQITGIIFSLSIIYKIVYTTELFVLIFAAFAALYTAAAYFAFMKMPEKWVKVTNITDIIFNIAAAVFAAGLLISDFGSWDIYCFLTALLYIGYTAVRGVRRGNVFLKSAECVVSSIAAYNLYCLMDIKDFAVPEFLLVCMMFALAMIHHFAKPLRTLFSDIFLTAGLTVSAAFCALTLGLFEYNICGTLGFALLGAAMLLKAVEADKKRAVVFKVLLPLPVSGIVFSFINFILNISGSLGNLAAVNGIVLALTAAAIMFARKKSDPTFYSFAFTASVFIFIGTASELIAVLIILLAVSVMLTVLFCRCRNNFPSLLTMAGTAAVVYRLADIASLHADFNVSLLFAAVFAAVCLAASRIFYSKKLLDREEGRLHLDTCCLEMLLALPLIHSANEKVTAFAVLTILAAFAANLVRKEHSGDANRAALTIACGLFAVALIFRPFLIVSDGLVSRKITLGIISAFGFAFSKIWAKYPKLSENFSSAVYGISFVCLIIDALSHQNLFNTLIVLAVSALILLYSFISKKKRWFAVSSVSLLGLTIYTFRDFFTMIDWWVYLLIVGLILIAVSAANEYFVRKGREFKEKAGRFFEDWKW